MFGCVDQRLALLGTAPLFALGIGVVEAERDGMAELVFETSNKIRRWRRAAAARNRSRMRFCDERRGVLTIS
jgi:hypothetical protein